VVVAKVGINEDLGRNSTYLDLSDLLIPSGTAAKGESGVEDRALLENAEINAP
jgi:hypothetical protein